MPVLAEGVPRCSMSRFEFVITDGVCNCMFLLIGVRFSVKRSRHITILFGCENALCLLRKMIIAVYCNNC